MKNNMYLLLLLLFLWCTAPLFATWESGILSRQEVAAVLADNVDRPRMGGNYLREQPLDYLNSEIKYMRGIGMLDHWIYYDCKKSRLSEIDAQYNRMESFLPGSICNQFDIASYLISTNKNASLRTCLVDVIHDHYFDLYNIAVKIKKPRERIVTLFTVAILSNNKEAIDILFENIKDHLKLGISREQIYYATLQDLVFYEGPEKDADDHYNSAYQNLIKDKPQREQLKSMMVESIRYQDKPRTDAYIKYVHEKIPASERDDLMKDVFYGIIDYRIEYNIQ